MSEGPLGPATFWLEAIRHEMAALVGLVSEVASRDLTPVVHVESGGSDSTPALVTPIDLQPLIEAIRHAPAPVVQAADLSPLLEKLDEIAHVSRGLGSVKGGGGPSFVTSQVRNEPGQTLHVTVDAQPAGSSGLTNTELRATPVPVSGTVSVSNFPTTQPVSIASTVPVSGTFWQATQPVSLATNTPDVTDRAARLLGHVTVDNASIAVTGAFFQATQPVSAAALPLPAGAAQDGTDISAPTAMPAGGAGIRGWLSAIWTKLNGSLAVTGTFWQATQPVSIATNTPTLAAGTNTVGNLNEIRAATTYATVVSAAISLGATLTLPAAGAGLFHYITSIEITNYTGIARTGGATPVTVTTTNITGSPAFTFATAAAIGTTDIQRPILATPLKTTTANTATTIVAPVVTGSFWRINVTYFTAA